MASEKEMAALQRQAVKLIQAKKDGRKLTREEQQAVSTAYNRSVSRSVRNR